MLEPKLPFRPIHSYQDVFSIYFTSSQDLTQPQKRGGINSKEANEANVAGQAHGKSENLLARNGEATRRD